MICKIADTSYATIGMALKTKGKSDGLIFIGLGVNVM